MALAVSKKSIQIDDAEIGAVATRRGFDMQRKKYKNKEIYVTMGGYVYVDSRVTGIKLDTPLSLWDIETWKEIITLLKKTKKL